MAKVIFLDIDGVLNASHNYVKNWKSQKDWLEFSKKHQAEAEELGITMAFHMPIQYSIGWLNELIEETGAKVVISSTWRGRGAAYMQKVLDFEGVVCDVIDETIYNHKQIYEDRVPLYDHFSDYDVLRGEQIKLWLSQHPEVKKYVILDDDSDMLLEQEDNFVHVDNEYGFTRHDFIEALSILEGK